MTNSQQVASARQASAVNRVAHGHEVRFGPFTDPQVGNALLRAANLGGGLPADTLFLTGPDGTERWIWDQQAEFDGRQEFV